MFNLHKKLFEHRLNEIDFINVTAAFINCQDDQGYTQLHYAAEGGHREIIRTLVKNKADGEIKDKEGRLALHFAAVKLGHRTLPLLLSHNPKKVINSQDARGWTPLHYAAMADNKRAVDYFLQIKGCRLLRDKEGKTPLHVCAEKGHLVASRTIIDWLTKEGTVAEWINHRDAEGKTPLHYANASDQQELVELLIKLGSDPDAFDNAKHVPAHYKPSPKKSSSLEPEKKQLPTNFSFGPKWNSFFNKGLPPKSEKNPLSDEKSNPTDPSLSPKI